MKNLCPLSDSKSEIKLLMITTAFHFAKVTVTLQKATGDKMLL